MQLINQTTGMVEYDGPRAQFPGMDAYRHEEVEAEFNIAVSYIDGLEGFA